MKANFMISLFPIGVLRDRTYEAFVVVEGAYAGAGLGGLDVPQAMEDVVDWAVKRYKGILVTV
jgi:hypothetical protein